MVVLRMDSVCFKTSLQTGVVMPHVKLQEFQRRLTGEEDAPEAEAEGQLGTATSSAVPSCATLPPSLCSWSHPTVELEHQ